MLWIFCFAVLFLSCTLHAQAPVDSSQGFRIDFNGDHGRQDVQAARFIDWRFGTSPSIRREIDGVVITITSRSGQTKLAHDWYKAGFDHGARLASDGIILENLNSNDALVVTIQGLRPGKHRVVSWHNAVGAKPLCAFRVLIDGIAKQSGIRPSHRVIHDDDTQTWSGEIETHHEKPIEIAFEPQPSSERDLEDLNVILNGLAIDLPDPLCAARKPLPADHDEHVHETPTLQWTSPRGALKYDVYLGTNRELVLNADTKASEYRGTINDCTWDARSLALALRAKEHKPNFDIYWRVDSVDANGDKAIGPVWRFRIRALAFPEAEGHGRYAIGGRGGRVLEVTNLNDDGPGSLRAAIDTEGPRTIVFRVGGTIELKSKLVIRHPYVTVAGQTAPGDGICVRGFTFGSLGTHDAIIRHVRIRVGDEAKSTMDGTGFASCDHCIMDHCSVSWSIDEGVSTRGAGNITVQRCLISEALNIADHKKYKPGTGHSFAGSISGNIGSFHHNLLAHCAGRNWSLAGGLTRGGLFAGYLDIRNNVVYNWSHRTTDGGVKALNFVNNVYLPGPATKVFHFVKPDAGSVEDPQQYYIAGNWMEGHPEYDADNWLRGGVVVDEKHLASIKLKQPFCESLVQEQSAQECLADVLSDCGANLPRLDVHDQRIINEVKERRVTYHGSRGHLPGIIDTQQDVGGWPLLNTAEPPRDSDHDGMPDAWEEQHGSRPNDPNDANECVPSGFETRLETYLNSLTR